MGVVIEMCTCSSQQAIVPNYKSNLENDGIGQYNRNNNNIKNENNDNNIENIKKRKKISNGVLINNEQSNDTETFKNVVSNGASVLTPKNKIETNFSQKVKKKEKEKKTKKESDKKTNKPKNQKEENAQDNNEEELELENINISDTILSELIISEKINKIPKEKKKKIKGRNIVNIIVIGYNEVGKSSFCIRFVENRFEDFYIPSICNENFTKMMVYNDHNYKVNFVVILGGEKIQKQDNILTTGDFFIFLYDITKIRSFNQINLYLKQTKKFLYFYDKEGKNPNFCIVGNKSDLEGERKVGNEFLKSCLEKYNIKHFDISIKTGKNVNNIIHNFIQIFDKIAFSSK